MLMLVSGFALFGEHDHIKNVKTRLWQLNVFEKQSKPP